MVSHLFGRDERRVSVRGRTQACHYPANRRTTYCRTGISPGPCFIHPFADSLLNREADIAVRMATPVQEQLIARRMGRVEIGLHAAPAYLSRRGAPESIDELFTHTLVGFDNLTPFILQALKQYPQLNRDLFTVRTDSDIAQLNLIRAGAGIGMCQVQLADFSPPLQRIMPDYFAFHLDTWLVMHEDLRHSQACKTVFDFLAEGLQAYINRAKR